MQSLEMRRDILLQVPGNKRQVGLSRQVGLARHVDLAPEQD